MSRGPVPGLTIEQQPPNLLLAMCLWGESRGEGPVGMLHVAQVIVNRAYPGQMMPRSLDRDGGLKLRDVILKPLQFSCFNTSDPNREKLLEAHKLDAISWGQAVAISELVIGGHALDPTLGSVNYLTKELYESDAAPKWAKSMRVMVKHGNHVFGRA